MMDIMCMMDIIDMVDIIQMVDTMCIVDIYDGHHSFIWDIMYVHTW